MSIKTEDVRNAISKNNASLTQSQWIWLAWYCLNRKSAATDTAESVAQEYIEKCAASIPAPILSKYRVIDGQWKELASNERF